MKNGREIRIYALAVAVAAAIFALDLTLPLGVATGVLYVGLVLMGPWFGTSQHILALAGIGTVLTLAGAVLSPGTSTLDSLSPHHHDIMATVNRGLSIFVIWVTAVLLISRTKTLTAIHARDAHAKYLHRLLVDAFESVPTMMALYDADDRFIMCNTAYRQTLSKIEDLLVEGTPFWDISYAGAKRGMVEGYQDSPAAWADMRTARLRNPGGPVVHQQQDGRWVITTDYKTHDGGTFITRTDITTVKNAEDQIRESEKRLADIIGVMSDWYWEMGPDLRFTFISDRFYEDTPFGPDDIIGKTRNEFLGPEQIARDPELWERHDRILANREPMHNFIYTREGMPGDIRYVSITCVPFYNDSGDFLGYRGSATDVTGSKQLEEDLRLAWEESDTANRAKSELLANMSHELRTPLNAIIGFSETILNQTFGPVNNQKYMDYLSDIQSSGLHLLDLINDILDVSAIESGQLKLNEGTVDLGQLVVSAVRMVAARAADENIHIINTLLVGQFILRADERRVKQVLLNLLSNAVKFTTEGGTITIEASLTQDNSLDVAISDTGIGMSDEDMKKALQPFGQADSGLNRKKEGSGLGLPLTKSLMELHGGSLSLESQPGKGTTVTVRFPATRVRPPNTDPDEPERPGI